MPGLWIDRLVPVTVRIHQGSETMVVAALGRLRAEDERMAGDAEAALGSLTWDQGLQAITQHGLQTFLWYELPRKWLTDLEGKLHIARGVPEVVPRAQRTCDSTAMVRHRVLPSRWRCWWSGRSSTLRYAAFAS